MKAVIFDMDGVLFFTESLNFMAAKETCRKRGIAISKADYVKHMVGKRTNEAVISFLESKGLDVSMAQEMVADFRRMKREVFRSGAKDAVLMRPGTVDALIGLSSRYRIALATSSIREFTMELLERFKIGKYFEAVLTAEDTKNGKPDPEIYRKASEALKLPTRECIAIEDTVHGIMSAKGAGMKCIGIKTPEFNNREISIADAVISGFGELTPALIENIGKSR